MLEHGKELIIGIELIMKALGVKRTIVGIENNKRDAIEELGKLAKLADGIEICPLKIQYPQGGEKQLIQATTGKFVPSGGLPIAVGAVVQNVGTVYAVYEAVMKHKPLFERVVTVTGKSLKEPGNYLCRIGTPISQLIEAAGGLPEDTGKVIGGGPMMGKALTNTSIPVTKGTSGILLMRQEESTRKEYRNCIRCSKCVNVCPMGLEPYYLMVLGEHNKLEMLGGERTQGVGLVIPDNPDKWYISIGDAATATNESKQWERSTVSMLGRVLYNYKGRYLFNGSFRRDGSSAFSYTGNQWQNFYSVGAGWLMSEEEFMKDITWLDMLKLKGSWGTLGNQNLDKAYPAEPLLTNAYSAVFGKPSAIYPGYQLSYLPNPRLRWEKVEAWEAGAEANFFRNRLHFEGVYYKKTTKDLLAEVPGISGTVPGIGNLGSIENKGVELAIDWRDRIGDWGYSAGFNLTTIKNKVLSLVQEGYSIIAGDKSQSYTMAGYPIGYFYGYKVEGVYQTDEEIARSPKNTLATVTPGDLKFKDVNGDGEITTADRTLIGDPTPNVTYGIVLGVSYKNWELGIDMMGQGGNQIFRTWDNYNWSQFNFMEQRMDRWHGPGTSNTQPLLNTKHTINNMNSEYYIEDGSFFRIRNVQLAYNFDKTLISRIGMQALKLYVNIQNLKTWKHNTGYTPELGGTAIAFGVDDGSYPMPAIYTFGFNLTF